MILALLELDPLGVAKWTISESMAAKLLAVFMADNNAMERTILLGN